MEMAQLISHDLNVQLWRYVYVCVCVCVCVRACVRVCVCVLSADVVLVILFHLELLHYVNVWTSGRDAC